jgi:peptide/nickel transport system substrate-binding protein
MGAIYDGPIDTFTNGYQPVILEKIPTIENGDAQAAAVSVKRGDPVVDAAGNFKVLDFGLNVLPSGCREDACAVKYDGRTDLKMDQLVVTFHLKTGLTWSDGTPLTSADSVFAFKLASDKDTPGSKYLIDRTDSYEAVDDQTVQWWGVPGFVDASYSSNFWSPLPKHLWEKIPAAELAKGDVKAHPPLGWGAYIFKEWSPGNYISLEKNPAYFRTSEGLPRFDNLTFLFVKDAATGISALVAHQCDVLDTSLRLESEISLLTELQRSDQVKLVTATTPLIERLDFGIKPASYEDGYTPGAGGDRPDILSDVRTRQGIAYCLDRQKVVTTVLGGISKVPDTFISPSHPLYNTETAKYAFNINTGIGLLEQAGWMDVDNNPATPRVAANVKNVPNGTPLVLNYWTTSALQRRQVSEILTQSLAQCGVGVETKYFSQDEFYAPGPDGPLFGRKFDLAEYAIGNIGTEPPCAWFMSDQVPTKANKWLGVNISGYANPDYDALCRKALSSLPGSPEYKDAYGRVQTIFANDLPSVPLYMRIKAAATRSDMCNFSLDAFAVNDLWNIEEFEFGPTCAG